MVTFDELEHLLVSINAATDKKNRNFLEQQLKTWLHADPQENIVVLVSFSALPHLDLLNIDQARLATVQGAAQLAALRAMNFLRFEADENDDFGDALRTALLQAVPRASMAIRKALLECVRIIYASDVGWLELIPQASNALIEALNVNEDSKMLACLQLIYCGTKKHKFVWGAALSERDSLAASLVPLLQQCLGRSRSISHMTLKVFECFVINTPLPTVLKGGDTLTAWMEEMLGQTQSARPETYDLVNAEYVAYAKMMKRIGRIASRLIDIFQATMNNTGAQKKNSKLKKKPPQLAVIAQKFVSSGTAAKFAAMWVTWLRAAAALPSDEDRSFHEKISKEALKYLCACTKIKEIYNILPFEDLTQNVLMPYLFFNETENRAWEEDPREWVRTAGSTCFEDQSSFKNVITKTYKSLLTLKRDFSNPNHLFQFLQFLNAQLSSDDWRRVDAALYALAAFHPVILRDPSLVSHMETVLVEKVAPNLHRSGTECDTAVLRARAVWVCSVFNKVPFSSEESFSSMLHTVTGLVQDPVLAVRQQVIAAVATKLLRNRRAWKYLKTALLPIADESIRQLDSLTSDFAVDALNSLLSSFPAELSDKIENIFKVLQRAFYAAFQEMKHEEQNHAAAAEAAGGDTDAQIQVAMETGDAAGGNELTLMMILRAMKSLVKAIMYQPSLLSALQPFISDIVATTLGSGSDSNLVLVEESAELFSLLLWYSEDIPITTNCWAVLPLIHHLVVVAGNSDIFENFYSSLDNLMARGMSTLFEANDGVDRPKLAIEICEYMLMTDFLYGGMKKMIRDAAALLTIILQHAKPYCRPAFDGYLPQVLDLLSRAISKFYTDEPDHGILGALYCALWDAFAYDKDIVLNFFCLKDASLSIFQGYFHLVAKCDVITTGKPVAPPSGRRIGASLGKGQALFTPLERKAQVLGLLEFISAATSQANPQTLRQFVAPAAQRAVESIQYNSKFEYPKMVQQLQKDIAEADDVSSDDESVMSEADVDYEAEDENSSDEIKEDMLLEDEGGDDDEEASSVIDSVCEATHAMTLFQQLAAADVIASLFPSGFNGIPEIIQEAVAQSQQLIAARAAYKEMHKNQFVRRAQAMQ